MLTVQERESIVKSVDAAIRTAYNMIQVINAISIKKDLVSRIIVSKEQISEAAACDKVDELNSYLPRLETFSQRVAEIKNVEDDIPDVFKAFLESEFVAYAWDNVHLATAYVTQNLLEFLQRNDSTILPKDSNILQCLYQLPNQYRTNIIDFEGKVSKYQIFNRIKWITNNIVMIGANGSGKSTFARQLKGKISSNVSILSAQHLLVYKKKDSIPTGGNEIEKVHTFQKNAKLSSDSNFSSLIGDDMNQLITALIADHTDQACSYYNTDIKKESTLKKAVQVWEELIEHRSIIIGRGSLDIKPKQGEPYDFNSLSDGEKAVFYYIGHVLLVERNSYIIIDEPENHLNLAICNKLWDKLESIRSDCKFIYLTHNVDFAISRTNCTKIWNRQFTAPDSWDFEIIESDDTMPDSLLIEVLGSRKNICFCEGDDKSSLDYKLYSILFPQYTVIPVGGHLDVISYTKAYNESSVCPYEAIGIIDGDCHLDAQVRKWAQQKVYAIPINEVENVFCDTSILQKAVDQFLPDSDALEKYYNRFWQELDRDKEKQTVWYVNNYLNNKFKDNFLHEKQDLTTLKSELQQITSDDEIDRLFRERIEKLNSLLSTRDYESAIRIANFKGKLTGQIARNTIADKYTDRILRLLKTNPDLCSIIISKYYSDIPQ